MDILYMRCAGLDMVSEHRVVGRTTPENVRYLAAKRDRAGHALDFESSDRRVLEAGLGRLGGGL
jgi:hypothetical protein